MKNQQLAAKLGISLEALYQRRYMERRRGYSIDPRPGEKPLKVWIYEEAPRRGKSPKALQQWMWIHGEYPPLRRVNQRVIYVIAQ